jgi:hypothetical protein
MTDGSRDGLSLLARLAPNAGIGPLAIGIVMPLLRPSELTVWAIALVLAITGAACLRASHWLLAKRDD